SDGSGFDRADAETVPRDVQLRTLKRKGLDGDTEFEHAQAVVGERDYAVRFAHGRILAHIGITASRNPEWFATHCLAGGSHDRFSSEIRCYRGGSGGLFRGPGALRSIACV